MFIDVFLGGGPGGYPVLWGLLEGTLGVLWGPLEGNYPGPAGAIIIKN